MNTIGNFAPDFEIPGIDESVYHLGSYRRKFKAIAVVFMSINSPQVEQYLDRLKQMQSDFGEQSFTIMGIDSNHYDLAIADTMQQMREYAQAKQLNFPFLRDTTQDVAKSFKAKVIPTVYLLDSDGVIRYQGVIDDQAESAEKVQNHYLRDSITAMLKDQKSARDYVEPVGDQIQWRNA